MKDNQMLPWFAFGKAKFFLNNKYYYAANKNKNPLFKKKCIASVEKQFRRSAFKFKCVEWYIK